jgi:hypothetical protein
MDIEDSSMSLLQDWCREAVTRYGDDWTKIGKFVQDRIAALGEVDRLKFARDVSLLIRACRDEPSCLPPH